MLCYAMLKPPSVWCCKAPHSRTDL